MKAVLKDAMCSTGWTQKPGWFRSVTGPARTDFAIETETNKTVMTKTPGPKNSNSKLVVNRKQAVPTPKPPKRENTFSKSRDLCEDRGTRQAKTTHNSQTLPHGR